VWIVTQNGKLTIVNKLVTYDRKLKMKLINNYLEKLHYLIL